MGMLEGESVESVESVVFGNSGVGELGAFRVGVRGEDLY